MRVLKGIYNFFKVFVLLLIGRRRILKVTKKSDAAILLKRLVDKGFVSLSVVSRKMAQQSEKDMRRQVRKAVKKGKKITVKELVNPVKEDPEFLKVCNELGLSLQFFEGLAKTAIEEESR